MAKKQIDRISDLADVGKENSGTLYRAAIVEIDENGRLKRPLSVSTLLLNPSSWEESKTANWVENAVPGQSDPVFQWSHSGARVINFDALVTWDHSYYDSGLESQSAGQGAVNKALSFVGKIASNFFKISVPPVGRTVGTKLASNDFLDISKYLDYYRSLVYPEYDKVKDPKKLRRSPPLVALFAGNTFSNIPYGERISNNHDLFIVKSIRIKITKQLPNLAPMEAVVSFELAQYNIRSFDRNRFLNNG